MAKPKSEKLAVGRPRYKEIDGKVEESIITTIENILTTYYPYPKDTIHKIVKGTIEEIYNLLVAGKVVKLPKICDLYIKEPKNPTRYHFNRVNKTWEYGVSRRHLRLKENELIFRALNWGDHDTGL
jgi:hypothetical protein